MKLKYYARLIRFDKPIGTLLLLWPTLWALWIANHGCPPIKILLIFMSGVFLMRSAGCAINDYADRHFDAHVARTQTRPLATGEIKSWEALLIFVGLSVIAFILVLQLNIYTIALSFVAVTLAAIYPFTKRFTHLPQFVLGLAFAWAIPMAFAASQNNIPAYAWLLFLIAVLWPVSYDTFYALADRQDDLNIGVKSTAILFGQHALLFVAILQIIVLLLLSWLGLILRLAWPFYIALIAAALSFIYQHECCRKQKPNAYFQAFLDNHWTGLLIFIGFAFAHPSA